MYSIFPQNCLFLILNMGKQYIWISKCFLNQQNLQVEILNTDFFQNFRNKIEIQNIEICLLKLKTEDILKINW
jgi:hypothetical protein